MLWLVGWTVGCVFLTRMVIRQPNLFNILFAAPFWASWLFVFFFMIKTFFQQDELLLDREGAPICGKCSSGSRRAWCRWPKYDRSINTP